MPTANRSEYLTIGSIIIGTAAAWATNMEVLYNEEHRGRDRLVPGTAGIVSNPRRLGPITHVLRLVINGRFDSDGNANSDDHQGLRDNITELQGITAPVTTGDGTRSVTWTLPDTSTLSANCHVGPLRTGRVSGPVMFATLDLHVPSGEFT